MEDTEMWHKRHKPQYLNPVMNLRQRVTFIIWRIIWFIALIYFWEWWRRDGHVVTAVGFVVTSMVLFWETVLPLYFFTLVSRMKRANPNIEPPMGRVLLGICETPGESWKTVGRPTVRAALIATQRYTRQTGNKAMVGLFHENPNADPAIADFCKRHGVAVLTRFGKPQYHNSEFPFRTKSKEGNLNGNIVEYGLLRKFDFIFTFDCDHVPAPDYLINAMSYFADPDVGIVSAPSICDKNLDVSWVVKARSDIEAGLHGAQQAGSSFPFASMAIGSHYGCRTAALATHMHPKRESVFSKNIEYIRIPFGPELAEDHSTTFATNVAGWKSVHAFDAEAHGDGAVSFTDSMTQEFQWSRSLMVILVKWTRGYFKIAQMGRIKKMQFLFSQMWYPLFAFTMLLAHLMAPIALITRQSWVSVDYGEFLLHWAPLTAVCILAIKWVRKQGFMRPTNAGILSWQSFLFQLVRWPWALYGVLQGFIGAVILNRELPFKVTPKGVKGAQPLPIKALVPYFLIVAVSIGTALAVRNPGQARGYYWFCLLDGLLYLSVIAAIVFLHIRENQSKMTKPVMFFMWKPIVMFLATFALFMAGTVVRGKQALWGITGNPNFVGPVRTITIKYLPNGQRMTEEIPDPAYNPEIDIPVVQLQREGMHP